ncbi:hypothetical protein TRVL_04577 [Trypanosoma vivax]|uniref:Trichohyalin-plectin-homology domain-containing protein n=1 Tax=Trypanosoma vivax (strain Y486) TaxID=1055687 RepID=G0UAS1_TRYVY|nr:hypothetical protein TRVL_04577 [Trypanosoma vivax]CCC52907.1 conserved hypothetical protein [Trypanosoma vivax Y486]
MRAGGMPSVAHPTTRARVDPKRKFGLANAVALGKLVHRTSIMGESELEAIRRLLSADNDTYGEYRRSVDEQRLEASRARTANWLDTVDAKREAFIRRRQEEKEEEVRRKNVLIELSKQQMIEERRQKQAHLALKLMNEDPRSRNVRSILLLDAALKDRDAQLAFKAHLKEKEEEERKKELETILTGLEDHITKEQQEKMDRISRNVDEKNSHLQQMLYQIEERRKNRAEEKKGRAEVERLAEEERIENMEELEEARKKIKAVNEYNRSIAKPFMTKHDRLRKRIKEEENDNSNRRLQEDRIAALKAKANERIANRLKNFEKAKEISFKACEAEQARMLHKERTQDYFEEHGISMIEQLASREDERLQEMMEERKRLEQIMRRRAEGDFEDEKLPETVWRAATHRAGFSNEEEARAYQLQMQKHPALVKQEQLELAAKMRAEGELLQRIHKLQTAERRENEELEKKRNEEEWKMWQEAMHDDDSRYLAFVKSQLPANMNPYLREKALELKF